ncbi:MAG: PucR family transcriptional regulator [Lachnospiraceae bacterium]|nr:PucR family transcriptional regulator [Lachnospiraceae bacterium]
MISNQIIQTTIDDLRTITRVDLCVMDVSGTITATTFDVNNIAKEIITDFANSPAESQSLQGCCFFKVYNEGQLEYILLARGTTEDAYMIGRVAVSQLQGLIVAYKERFDRNNFIQNLLLDNLLLVDIYSQAKKLQVSIEAMRVVYLVETKDEKDVMTLETVRSIFAPKSQDVITAVDENNIVVVKEVGANDNYESLEKIAQMLVDMLNTEAVAKVRVSYGTIVNQLKDVSKSFKEAKMAMDVGKVFYPEKTIVAYHTLGIGRLIYQLPLPLCEMFLHEVFGNVSPDTFDEETLLTINKFFENNLNVSETARQLFIHRNTLVYRLEKLEKNTGLDIRIFEDALAFKIALMVEKYMEYLEHIQ